MALVKNKITGSVTEVPDHYLDHPVLGADWEVYTDKENSAEVTKDSAKKEQTAPETTK
jgi:hypothetical protein